MARRGTKEIPGTENLFPQKRIQKIETWIDRADALRAQITEAKEKLKNAEFKLREALHEHAAGVQQEQTEDGGRVLRYERGTYAAEAKHGRETVNYTRAGEAKTTLSVESNGADEGSDEEAGE
jgi:predicted  nucleic acid-binding Zn-ribbon protein